MEGKGWGGDGNLKVGLKLGWNQWSYRTPTHSPPAGEGKGGFKLFFLLFKQTNKQKRQRSMNAAYQLNQFIAKAYLSEMPALLVILRCKLHTEKESLECTFATEGRPDAHTHGEWQVVSGGGGSEHDAASGPSLCLPAIPSCPSQRGAQPINQVNFVSLFPLSSLNFILFSKMEKIKNKKTTKLF